MTLALILVTSLAVLSSAFALGFAARISKLSREATERSTQAAMGHMEQATRAALAQSMLMTRRSLREAHGTVLACQQEATRASVAAMEAARTMVQHVTSALYPTASAPPPPDSLPPEQRAAVTEPWDSDQPFGAELREQDEDVEAAWSRLRPTGPAGPFPGRGMVPPPMATMQEPPAGWSSRPPHPEMVTREDDERALADAEALFRSDRAFDPSP